jgi:myo-inositol 2-dehydrogenase / D-chiro-inositol 1-dehydrogenase
VTEDRPRLRLALVGCGRQGRAHLRALASARRVALAAVCDPEPGAAAAAAPADVPADTELEHTLARDEVEAVVIAAPTPAHEAIVEAALAAGRHVLCEKPLTFDPAADARLAEKAARGGLVLHVGFLRRHGTPYLEAARLLHAGAIGEPRLLRAAQWDASPPGPAFLDPAVSGGLEVDCGIHEMDLAAWLLGSPVARVAAVDAPSRAEIAEAGDVEALAALAATAAGHPVTVDLHRSCRFDDLVRSELVGSEGALVVTFWGAGSLELGDAAGLRAVDGVVNGGDVVSAALARQRDAFAAAVGGEPVDAAGPAESAAALAASLAMRRARLSGGWENVG